MKIELISFDPDLGDAVRALGIPGVAVFDADHPDRVPSEMRARAVGVLARLGVTFDRDVLTQFPSLKFFATATTGLDHVDGDFCRERKIEIVSLKGETAFLESIHATPEMTWGLLLALIRKIPWSFTAASRGEWRTRDFVGTELNGKTIGIIGFGRVGKIVANYAHAFGMTVLSHNDAPTPAQGFPYRSVGLDELLAQSDVVSLHLPLNEGTKGFFNAACFLKMKRDAVFINTARGALVDEAALVKELTEGGIRGAAIDVLSDETFVTGVSAATPLIAYARTHQNLLVTCHTAGATRESMVATARFIATKVRGFI